VYRLDRSGSPQTINWLAIDYLQTNASSLARPFDDQSQFPQLFVATQEPKQRCPISNVQWFAAQQEIKHFSTTNRNCLIDTTGNENTVAENREFIRRIEDGFGVGINQQKRRWGRLRHVKNQKAKELLWHT